MACYLILTGCDHGAALAEVDQIVPDLASAKSEARDLAAMAGPCRVYEFADWEAAETYSDEKDTAYPSKTVAKLVYTAHSRD